MNYSEYIAENLDVNIKYSEYIVDNLENNNSYSEYIAESLENNISYADYKEDIETEAQKAERIRKLRQKKLERVFKKDTIKEKLDKIKENLK